MLEILPIKQLAVEDAPIFGSLNVALASLARGGLGASEGVIVTPPDLHLKALLEHYDFGSKEIFEQSLTLVKKEIAKVLVPEELVRETKKHDKFLVSGQEVKSTKKLWILLLNLWLEEIKQRLWKDGFTEGLTESLEPQIIVFINKPMAYGSAYFDQILDDTAIQVKQGSLKPNDLKKLDELVMEANRKLLIPHSYEWILDLPAGRQGGGVKLTKVLPYTPNPVIQEIRPTRSDAQDLVGRLGNKPKSAVKVFLDLSTGLVIEKDVDGIYIASEKIFDLNKPRDSFEDLVFRLVESANTFPNLPVLFKLADKSEGMGKVRGTLRLLHQKSLFDPMIDALDFVRHKKGTTNVHLVIPFVRGPNEFLQIKRELAVKKFTRKNSLELWLEVAVPENIINLEEYLVAGLDGIVLNMDELIAHLNGFDHTQEDLMFYKNEVSGLLKFIEDGLKLMHKSKIPFIAYGTLALYPQVLEYLVERGVWGIVVERYEAPSAHELLHQAEKRMILRRIS